MSSPEISHSPAKAGPLAPPVAGQKRSAPGTNNPGYRAVKRRASKACQCCRARKVRCNVVESGPPCTNCRLDEVECIVTESKRRKKNWGLKLDSGNSANGGLSSGDSSMTPNVTTDYHFTHSPSSADGHSEQESNGHVPHLIYQTHDARRASYASSHASIPSLSNPYTPQSSVTASFPHRVSHHHTQFLPCELPKYIKPTPNQIPRDDLEFLSRKGALTLPDEPLRSELLKAHFDVVHPFMPLLDRRQFMKIVRKEDGSAGKVGLLLFQAVMFSGSAFVSMDMLRAAGFTSRKAARKYMFTKTRLLYDFDYEQDRMILVQALLLMTYWYETPDDQKDTWHWMGVAVSLSHTIGLHRNPEGANMSTRRQKLWKRIWWCCYMRDRLVALGMRRPIRIKSEDCDVPMLTIEDFDIDIGMDEKESAFLSYDERRQREKEAAKQRELAIMCIEKAKLCVCISRVLDVQYSVLNTNHGSTTSDGSTRTTMMLLPKKLEPGCPEVRECDEELTRWKQELPIEAIYRTIPPDVLEIDDQLALHRNLLHLVYNTTVSALHRPQVLPSYPEHWPSKGSVGTESQESSRLKVRHAASEITKLAEELIEFDLVKFLPTTGVTVILPAVIIHLLDIKSEHEATREKSLEGFALCMQVLQVLRQSYSAADYATHFLEAAIKKAGISVDGLRRRATRKRVHDLAMSSKSTYKSLVGRPVPSPFPVAGISMPSTAPPSNAALTPPPDAEPLTPRLEAENNEELQNKLETFLHTPPSPHLENGADSVMIDASNGLNAEAMYRTLSEQNSHGLHPSGPTPGGNFDSFLDCDSSVQDPFMGDDSGLIAQNNKLDNMNKPFDFNQSWLENGVDDMSRFLDGVDFDIDDVIQVLETEIN